MRWIRLKHTGGSELINVYQIHRIHPSSTTSIEIFPIGGSSYILDLGNANIRDKTIKALSEILTPIDLTKITSYASQSGSSRSSSSSI